jgi:hypothetical protein
MTYRRQCGQGPVRAPELFWSSHSARVVHVAVREIVQGEVLHGEGCRLGDLGSVWFDRQEPWLGREWLVATLRRSGVVTEHTEHHYHGRDGQRSGQLTYVITVSKRERQRRGGEKEGGGGGQVILRMQVVWTLGCAGRIRQLVRLCQGRSRRRTAVCRAGWYEGSCRRKHAAVRRWTE